MTIRLQSGELWVIFGVGYQVVIAGGAKLMIRLVLLYTTLFTSRSKFKHLKQPVHVDTVFGDDALGGYE